jgi:AcrR family transcriptional regulator
MAGDPRTRDRILDAAEVRLLEGGPAALVLDAVAAEAGVSKGGLLHHFPSKAALAEALVGRMVERFDRAQDALAADDPEARGRSTRAYLRSTVSEQGAPADASASLMAGILAGLGGDRARLEALREGFARWQERLEHDGIDPVRATIVRLAVDGLWLSALLGFSPVEKRLGARVLAALDALSRE